MVSDPIGDGLDPGAKPDRRTEERETRRRSPVERYKESFNEAVELKGFSDGLGMGVEGMIHGATGKTSPEELVAHKTTMDITKSIVEESLKTSREIASEARTAQREAFDSQLSDLKERVDRAEGAGGTSAIQQFKEIKDIMKMMTEELSQSLGLGKTPTSASDMPKMIELENLRMKHDTDDRNWKQEREEWREEMKTQREERERRWVMEDRKWEGEYKLKVAEFQHGANVKDKAAEQLTDLASAFMKDMESGQAEGAPAPAPMRQQAAPEPPRPTSFTCKQEGCGAVIQMPAGASEATCSKCGAVYELEAR